jgi:Uncharacterized conserved protein
VQKELTYEVGVKLVDRILPESGRVRKVWELLNSDVETQAYLKMANVFAVQRLKYNDHGPVHSSIVTGSALAVFKILTEKGFKPSVVVDGVGDMEDAHGRNADGGVSPRHRKLGAQDSPPHILRLVDG